MDRKPSADAPSATTVLSYVGSVTRKSKWLIGVATLIAVCLTFVLYRPDANQIQAWTGKTTLTIGVAPPVDYILQLSGPPLAPIESPRDTVMQISDPVLKTKVVNQAAFKPAKAAFSQSMVFSSLRAIAGESSRQVTVELTAGSAADVQAAFVSLAAAIGQVHGELLERRLKPLRARIENTKSRLSAMEKSAAALNDQIFSVNPDDKTTRQGAPVYTPTLVVSLGVWNDLQDRIQRDTTLIQLSEPSVMHFDADTYPVMERSSGSLKASILAGLVMLAAMIVLTIVISPPAKGSRN